MDQLNFRRISILIICILLAAGCADNLTMGQQEERLKGMSSIYDFVVKDIDGEEVKLGKYEGKVILIVNVASKCGFTPQYKGLQELYEKYQSEGLVILGFPANDFMGQEPGSNEKIKQFCSLTYGVTFPMFSKISVKGGDIEPLYLYLTDASTNPEFSGDISWNFNKFLIGRDGTILNRFDSKDNPRSDKVLHAIREALQST